jgi:hypothetical protein
LCSYCISAIASVSASSVAVDSAVGDALFGVLRLPAVAGVPAIVDSFHIVAVPAVEDIPAVANVSAVARFLLLQGFCYCWRLLSSLLLLLFD